MQQRGVVAMKNKEAWKITQKFSPFLEFIGTQLTIAKFRII